MSKVILIPLIFLLAACDCHYESNQVRQHEYFLECLHLVTPEYTAMSTYTEIEDMISECGRQASIMSTEFTCKE